MTARIKYEADAKAFAEFFVEKVNRKMVDAAYKAITEAGQKVKVQARADIQRSGLGQGFVQAMRVDIYPKNKPSLNAAAHVYHKIPYAGVFEDGATIRGKPTMWVPLPDRPKKIRRERITPTLYEKSVGPLQYVRMPGKPPMLFAKMKEGRGETKGQITLPRLRAAARPGAKGPFMSVPIFVGLSTTKIKKRLNIKMIVTKARDQLAGLYFKNVGK